MTIQERMKAKLESLGLPYKEIKVYGLQITITARSETAANKWYGVICRFTDSRRPVRSFEHNKANEGSCLLPSRHEVWLIGGRINV